MEEITIDLKDLFQVLMDNKKKVAAITAAFMIAGGAYLAIASPVYQSTSLLRIKQDKGLADSIMSKVTNGDAAGSKQRMMTDAEILKSRNVVLPVIAATEEKDEDGKLPDYESYVKKHIVTKPYKDTEILEVDVTGKDPETAQRANNLIIKGFMNRLTELSHDEQKRTREFLEQRLGASKEELGNAEDKLQQYQSANKMYSTDDQMKQLTDKLNIVDKAKAENQLDLETAQAGLKSVNEQLSSAGVAIADSPAIQQYKTQLAQLEATKASYVGKYTDEHPKMQEINNQINSAKASLDEEISNIVSQQAPSSNTVQQGLLANKFKDEAAIAVAQSKKTALDQMDAQNDAIIASLPEKEQGFVRVKRDADVANEIYVMLAKRLEEAKVAEVMVPNEVQVVDWGTLPEKPIKPRKVLIMAIMTLLGLIVGMGTVIIQSLMYRKIRTAEDVEKELGLPVLGMIPDINTLQEDLQRSSGLWSKIRRKLWRK
ncbi:GumC family protein [Megasphaera elsdenii]|uniref:GumC family protein n=1 Tax=Megasphaera elsdenii TaxID=907 RepID=UPI0006C779AA|nr:GumC family protein [Megasphaera elsdenii]ALG41876.1 chain-length determining protein [Megasphaera elsdenii 14-14]